MDANTILSALADAREAFDTRVLTGAVWNLCDDHFVEVVNALWSRLPYEMVAELCKKDLGLPGGKCPSKSALQRFWRDSGFLRLLQRHNRRAAQDGAQEITDELVEKPSNYATANVELIHQTAFEMLKGGATVDELKPFVGAVVRLNTIDLAEKKLRASLQTKIDAGLEELAKELPADLVEKIRAVLAAKMEEKA